jgi:DNA polymerase-3 subunit gamma/tau
MTLLRMLAFRPADAGSGGAVIAARPAANATGSSNAEPTAAKKAVENTPVKNENAAAKEARKAFDAMQSGKPDSASPAAEKKVEIATARSGNDPEPNWSRLQESLDLTGAARELARNLQLESTGGERWKFLVPDTLQHLGSKSVVQSLESALEERLGHKIMLDLHTASEPVDSVAAAVERTEVNRMSEAERAIDEDQTVQEIKEKFGARIIPDSVQPLQ